MQRYKVAIKADSGVAQAMRSHCDKCGISVWSFLQDTITERLQKPFDFSIAEIEQKKTNNKGSDYAEFYFGISDSICQEKIRSIKEQYGISRNYFFVKTITEKLSELGYTFNNTEIPVRKTKKKQTRKKSDVDNLLESLRKIDMMQY